MDGYRTPPDAAADRASEPARAGVAPKLRFISLGAGVQSSRLLLGADRGEFGPQPDCAIFADTQWEPERVYRHLDWLESVCSIPIHRVTAGSLRQAVLDRRNTTGGRVAAVPWFIVNPDGSKGMGLRQCTSEFKIKPIMHQIRDLLGVGRRDYIRPGAVECWIGISTDEASRMRPARQRYMTNTYPLIMKGESRDDCDRWLWDRFGRHAPKSACIGCPFHDNAAWREQRDRFRKSTLMRF